MGLEQYFITYRINTGMTMAIQTVAYDLKGIHDPAGYEEVMKALTTIGGVQAVHLVYFIA